MLPIRGIRAFYVEVPFIHGLLKLLESAEMISRWLTVDVSEIPLGLAGHSQHVADPLLFVIDSLVASDTHAMCPGLVPGGEVPKISPLGSSDSQDRQRDSGIQTWTH